MSLSSPSRASQPGHSGYHQLITLHSSSSAQRIKLGLKPLEVETSDSKPAAVEEQDPDALAEANFARVRDEARRDREQKALEERIAK